IVVAVAQAVALKDDADQDEWEAYKVKYGKNYESDEVEATRKAIYLDNKKRVAAHNERYQNGEVSFTVALNHLADLTTEEFARKLNGYKQKSTLRSSSNRTTFTATGAEVADSVDWRDENVVTPVKNQEDCGGCWAFSTTGSIEGQHAINTGTLVSLSEQNLIDCSSSYGNDGCDGGLMDDAFEYVIGNDGIDTESSYPFVTVDGQTESCTFSSSNVGATISSYADVTSGDET
ncbi:C1 family peptidase, partial [Neisseria meningitidis]|uniref:C1 family peptidase n=1 Tax=Neisseria meningitidis TaxID=487 RepID=UPI001C5B20FE